MNKTHSKYIQYSLQVAATVAIIYWLFREIDFTTLISTVKNMKMSWLSLSILVAGLNYLTRILRWKTAASKFHIHISVSDAAKSYFSGMSLGALTPGRVGEFSRILYIGEGSRLCLTSAIVIEKITGNGPMVIFAALSLIFVPILEWYWTLGLLLAGIAYTILTHWKIKWLVTLIKLLPVKLQQRINNKHWVEYLRDMKPLHIFQITTWSIIQYVLFIILFYSLLAGLTHTRPDAGLFFVLIIIFVLKSFLSFTIGEFGIRELISVYFLQNYGISNDIALSAALLMGVFDVIVPALLGLPFLKNMNLRKNKGY